MKIIFLDIDGVLNSVESMQKNHGKIKFSDIPDKKHIDCLNHIIEKTNAKVVISSTWRTGISSIYMWRFLSVLGFNGDIIGSTPKLDSYRGTEIMCWLKEHESKLVKYADSSWCTWKEPVESFVILDDDSDMESLLPYLVKTSNRYGLTMVEAEKAIEILNKGINNVD